MGTFGSTTEKTPAISFKNEPVGTTKGGTVVELPKEVQARDFDTDKPATWPDGNPKQTFVTTLMTEAGEKVGLWAPVPSAMLRALQDAETKLGRDLAVGDELAVTFTGEKPNPEKPRNAPQKLYSVKITPGVAKSGSFGQTDEAPF